MQSKSALEQIAINSNNNNNNSSHNNVSVGSKSGKEKKIEYLTDIVKCKSVFVSNLENFHAFSMPKKGFIRLLRDESKRGFFLELFMDCNKKQCKTIEVTLGVLNLAFTFALSWLNFSFVFARER